MVSPSGVVVSRVRVSWGLPRTGSEWALVTWGPAGRSTWEPPGWSTRGSGEDTRVPARPLCGSAVVLLREFAPRSRGELGVPLRVTWWVPSESGAARGGHGRAELAGRVAVECQSSSESRSHAAIQVGTPRAWECHAGSRGSRLPARRPGFGSPLCPAGGHLR